MPTYNPTDETFEPPVGTPDSLAKLEKERQELRVELTNAITHLVFRHGETLLRKKQQTVYRDDYGNLISDKFLVELEYFIQHVMCIEITPKIWNYIWKGDSNRTPLLILNEILGQFELIANSTIDFKKQFDSSITATEYEHFCSQELCRAGWDTKVTVASGDQGVDVIATAGGVKLVLQCKLYSTPVGNSAVQEIIAGRVFEHADHAAVVTNSTFTQSAKALASAANVLLLHHSELQNINSTLGISLKPLIDELLTSTGSRDQRSDYLSSLKARPINEIVQQIRVALAEREQLATNVSPTRNIGGSMIPSSALAEIVGHDLLSREEVVKRLWGYIKRNKLQSSTNIRLINTDKKLYAVFEKSEISMFEMAILLGKHLSQSP